jgi:hypothetical protein
MELISNEEKQTRALLVCVDTGGYDAEASMSELSELVESAGAEPVLLLTQKLPKPESATYVGSALSTWLFAALSERFGWPVTILSWGAAALCGLLLTLLCRALLEKRGAGEAKTPQVWKK